ncbi:MAG: YbhN family protein [Candidatus Coproplasma sp.]
MSIDEEKIKLNTPTDEIAAGGEDVPAAEIASPTPSSEVENTSQAVEDNASQSETENTVQAEVENISQTEAVQAEEITAASETVQSEDGEQECPSQNQAAATQAKPQKSKASKIILNVVLVMLIALGIYSLFKVVNEIPDASSSIGDVFANASPWFMVLLVVIVLSIMFLDCTKFCIIDKTVTGKVRLPSSVKTSFLGKYYDAVTPFSTGGQPMQIYYLNSKGISGGNSTAIVLIRYFSSILTWVSLGAVLMIVGTVNHVLDDTTGKTLLLVAGWVGVGVNLILPIFIAFFLIFPKAMIKLTRGIVRLGKKMKIVKDEEKTLKKATKVVDDFKHSFKVMATSPVMLIMLVLVSYAEAFLTFSVPYFVMKAFSCDVQGQFITIMALNAFATFGVSFIPTPGNSGVMEGMAALAFSAAAGNTLAWSVLVWRLAVYYIYIIIGLVITVRDIIKKNIINRRNKNKTRKNC